MDHIDFLHGGNMYKVKCKYKKDVIDFSANINPLGLTHRVKKELIENWEWILYYPDPESKDLIRRIARYWKIKEENILLGNGSSELIYLIVSVFGSERALIPAPTFSEYERAVRSIKSKIRFLILKEKEGFVFNATHSTKADMLFICNPNNPTGNLLLKNQRIENLHGKLIIIDEAFMDFLPDEKRHTFIWRATEDKKIIVLRTFTKFFALPGLRIGYIVAHPDLIKFLKKACSPWNINVFAQLLAEIMLSDKEYIRRTREFIRKERDFLYNEIIKIKGLKPYPSVTNFLLVKIENKKISSSFLTRKLVQKGLLIRDCSNFRNLDDKYIRAAVRSRKENIKLIEALREILCKS
ncbi:MAG: threonine-phosphate decarboxylase CobD [Thermodesulfobacteriota bacterium]